jgi:hypothetical protein
MIRNFFYIPFIKLRRFMKWSAFPVTVRSKLRNILPKDFQSWITMKESTFRNIPYYNIIILGIFGLGLVVPTDINDPRRYCKSNMAQVFFFNEQRGYRLFTYYEPSTSIHTWLKGAPNFNNTQNRNSLWKCVCMKLCSGSRFKNRKVEENEFKHIGILHRLW